MASAPSFEWGTRATPHDHGDMNRLFPGTLEGTLTQQLTHVLVDKVVRGSDLLLDYHSEPDAMNIRCTYARRPESAYGKQVMAAALASGTPVIYAAPSSPTTLAGYAEQAGILALTPELGGPLPEERYHLEYGWQELVNLLRHVGALPGTPEVSGRQWIVQDVAHVRPRAGGLFVPEAGFETLGTLVPGERVLGRVISPYTFGDLDALRGPYQENLLMVVRGRVSKVHPGDPAYIVGNAATAEVVDSRR
jgi:predicted deacylase